MLLIAPLFGSAQQTTFKLIGVQDYDGVIRVAVYSDEEGYKKEKTNMLYTFEKKELVFGFMKITLNLKPGKYAIAFLDDTNQDARMNYNLFGVPQEGYGFSRIVDYGFSKPDFKETLIEVKEGSNTFDIHFNYF
ncbi:DUF2141 domain-containing protein [Parvicella tangerina]|uniref:DUF2141 domain-containing protein n=1 Tax=Parvicella tangerina TaxID=2829795 RepID=A0A916NS67_9FLAO|nr:DUF2141 domain-containing protein [Parvicella tangerina]CAG5083153.1 hypothetical protein CRYO30217_02104 [Parvicella tangerina]